MSEEVINNTQEEVINTNNSTQIKENSQQNESIEEINWKVFRQEREKERKQRQEVEKIAQQKAKEAEALKQAMEALLNKPSYENKNSNEEEFDEEERINKKVEAALLKKQNEIEEQRKQNEIKELPKNLAKAYPDFNNVCNEDNLDYLEYHYPEVAQAFKYMPDGFDKWSTIYNAIKKFIPNLNGKKDQIKAEKNLSKPQSASIPGMVSTSDPGKPYLDDKRKSDNWARMQRTMKGI